MSNDDYMVTSHESEKKATTMKFTKDAQDKIKESGLGIVYPNLKNDHLTIVSIAYIRDEYFLIDDKNNVWSLKKSAPNWYNVDKQMKHKHMFTSHALKYLEGVVYCENCEEVMN